MANNQIKIHTWAHFQVFVLIEIYITFIKAEISSNRYSLSLFPVWGKKYHARPQRAKTFIWKTERTPATPKIWQFMTIEKKSAHLVQRNCYFKLKVFPLWGCESKPNQSMIWFLAKVFLYLFFCTFRCQNTMFYCILWSCSNSKGCNLYIYDK